MDNICFYNMNHLGDVYFSSIYINIICKLNNEINFLYYFICGDVFYEKIPNIQRINMIENSYKNNLNNGSPPEELIDNEVLNLLIQHDMQHKCAKIIEYNNKNILFVNTWGASECLQHTDYDLESSKYSYERLIQKLNTDYNLNLKFEINLNESFKDIFKIEIDDFSKLDNNTLFKNLHETIFIFNYRPRSICFDVNILSNFIRELSKNYQIILSTYDNTFDNNENIKFFDKDFNIYPDPKCLNLIYIWEIASKCSKIILLETGSCWTFLHKLKVLKENQLFLFNSNDYINRLNNLINVLSFENKSLVNIVNNTNMNDIFTKLSNN
jgi:hypothetical protein